MNDNEQTIVTEYGGFVPADPLNTDYLAYVAWLFEGNTPEEWEPASEPVIEETPADSTEEPVTEDGN
jgi:hypothetical protein